jgi:hypothetical protein
MGIWSWWFHVVQCSTIGMMIPGDLCRSSRDGLKPPSRRDLIRWIGLFGKEHREELKRMVLVGSYNQGWGVL